MKNWMISIIGVAFLSVLIDIIYPNGKTNAFCKSIFGIFAIFIMISPILKIDIKDVFTSNNVTYQINENIQKSKDEYYISKIEKGLESKDILGVDVEIESKMQDNVYEIENVYLDTSNIVLRENLTHTNKYEVIIQEILKIIEINNERIVIYG